MPFAFGACDSRGVTRPFRSAVVFAAALVALGSPPPGPVTAAPPDAPADAAPPHARTDGLADRFGKSVMAGTASARITTLQFGPDGRLYVGQQNGLIKAYTVERRGPGDYAATAVETIAAVQEIPNHDDDGTENPKQFTRLLTGILVTGTAEAPVVYATSSDPRIGGGKSGEEKDLDTNSGIVSRLTPDPDRSGWRRLDVVRGLPRSEENHTGNGLALSPDGRWLYVAQGGMTNNGAPSTHFALTPEYALSAAILSIDLGRIGDETYDLPTLDDAARPGATDAGDPFGGADGRNQARIVPGGPVQVHAAGFRNAYDLVITAAGRMYTVDNGANGGWGAPPEGEGPEGRCTNEVSEDGPDQPDLLHHVTGPGYYGGHPNPTRANPRNGFNPDLQSPVETGHPVECDHRTGAEAGALATFPTSTNGLAEYRAPNLGGALAGDLLAVSFDNRLYRVALSGDGRSARASVLFDEVATVPLDVTAPGDAGPFPGTVWVGDFAGGSVTVFEPDDYGGGGGAEAAAPATSAARPPRAR